MTYLGIVLHHSVCSSINGKGYDYFITTQGTIVPSYHPTDPEFLHICIEGDFSADPLIRFSPTFQEQLFALEKLMKYLSETFQFEETHLFPHNDSCPGPGFPWASLVISGKDGYH